MSGLECSIISKEGLLWPLVLVYCLKTENTLVTSRKTETW